MSGGVASAPAGALEFLAEPGRQRVAQPVQQTQQVHVVLAVVLGQDGPGLHTQREGSEVKRTAHSIRRCVSLISMRWCFAIYVNKSCVSKQQNNNWFLLKM